MRAASAKPRCRCAGCLVTAVAIAGALAGARCALEVRRHHAVSLVADLAGTASGPRAPRALASTTPRMRDDAAPRAMARGPRPACLRDELRLAAHAPASDPPGGRNVAAPGAAVARGATSAAPCLGQESAPAGVGIGVGVGAGVRVRAADASTAQDSGARSAPAERAPRVPRRGVTLSAPSDDRRGLPAIRRHRGAFLVRAVDPLDRPHRPSGSPHRELLRRVIGL